MTALTLVKSLSELQVRSPDLIRQAGYRVFFRHKRYYCVPTGRDDEVALVGPFTKKEAESFGYSYRNLWSRGGFTDLEIYRGDDLIVQGGARCSHRDNYVKRIGRQIALGRALAKIYHSEG